VRQGTNPAAAGRTITPEGAFAKRDCEYHPAIQAVFHLHNLYRDEHLTLCTSCMVAWCQGVLEHAFLGDSISNGDGHGAVESRLS
jgi:hypothetical protein